MGTLPQNLNEQSEIICSTFQHSTPQEALDVIDKHILEHEKSLLALKTLRNTFSPISKLPTEILCQIFYFSQDRYEVLDWIKVTYVSRQWRTVALNSPNLWTHLRPLDYRHWTSVMLDRSKMASLTVQVDFSRRQPNTIKPLESTFSHVDRFKRLSLEKGEASLLRSVVSKLPKSAPRLHSLIISVYHSTYADHDADTCDLPEDMLCETENLHYLELKRCNPSWDSHLLSSLSQLKIDWVSRAARPSKQQFLEMLKRMPNLEILELRDAIPVESPGSVPEKFHLSRLCSIVLSSHAAEIDNLLRYITFPSTTTVKIVAEAFPISGFNFSGMLSSLASILLSSDKKPGLNIGKLFIEGINGASQTVQIQASSKLKPPSDLFRRGLINPDLDLSFTYPTTRRTSPFKEFMDSVLPQVFHAFPLDNLDSLFLSRDFTFSKQILLDLFGSLNPLKLIVSTQNSTNSLLEVFQGVPTLWQSTSSPPKSSVIFPGLQSLALDGAVFESGDDPGPDCCTFDSLLDYFKKRHVHGVKLHELHLRDCYYLYSNEVNLLKEFVNDVTWDEVEQDLSDEEDSEEEDDEDDIEFEDGYDYDSDVDDPYDWDFS